MISYWIETILFMVGAIGALLLGFEILSTNITKLFHSSLKKIFNKTTKNPLLGVGIGVLSTVIVQSSAVTTVLVVGFVNTGIMNLAQATAVIMGANIGTTITAQLAALNSFNFSYYAIAFAGIGAFMIMLTKKERYKTLGHALAGFGILFIGLECVSLAIANEYNGEPLVKNTIQQVLTNVSNFGSFTPFLLFFLGIIITAIVQSSSLVTTIIISLSAAGIYIGAGDANHLNNNVLFLILGTNIGTCVTAILSSMGASTNAKRASVIHLLFNVFGSVLFMAFLLLYPSFMEDTFCKWFSEPATQIAMFHTFFNVTCTIIFIWFISIFVKLSTILVKDKKHPSKATDFVYIDERLINTPSVAVHQVRKELSLMYQKSVQVLNIALTAFLQKDESKKEVVDNLNEELEATNKLLTEFMVKLTNQNVAYEDECTLSSFHRTLNDILRIGEIGDNVCKYTRQTIHNNLEFSSSVYQEIEKMYNTIKVLHEKTDEIFLTKNLSKIKEADVIEEQVDMMRKNLIKDHFDRLNRGECQPQNSGVFVNLVNNLERAADHMIYIAYSVKEAFEQNKNR